MSFRHFVMSVVAMAIGIGLFAVTPVGAEEDLGVANTITEMGVDRYKVYAYPSASTDFFFYPETYVTFDAVNGKFWTLEVARDKMEMYDRPGVVDIFPIGQDYSALRPGKFRVYFYTPDMKLLGYYDKVLTHRYYSIPKDGNDYERIIVKIECHGERNHDVKFKVWDPVDPVMAEPIPAEVYRN